MTRFSLASIVCCILLSSSSSGVETCDPLIDIVFLYDESFSIPDNAFPQMKEFLVNIVKQFDVGQNAAQFAAICFGSDTKDHFFLKNHPTKQTVIDAIHAFKPGARGLTYTGKGLERIKNEYLKAANGGDRPSVTKVIIILTDGASTDNPIPIANQLKTDKVYIFGVAVGKFDLNEINKIASGPDFVYHVDDFSDLKTTVVQKIAENICTNIVPADDKDSEICDKDSVSKDSSNKQHRYGQVPIKIDLSIPILLSQNVGKVPEGAYKESNKGPYVHLGHVPAATYPYKAGTYNHVPVEDETTSY
ncbi:collagen alpha-1(XX) chain-like [Mytilus californianus]|uniref:collagen alpha-1(XX) chain-like n=1 Tax=Mytilus californianus TaxID=6549 RepID=UPI0022457305|nr:collagen alpha-1(XX) chain-like [Mytilus californianus]